MKNLGKWVFLSALFLTSCTVGPKLCLPEVDVGESFSYCTKEEPENLASWWENFSSPILQSLIEESLESNKDIQIALDRINEARGIYKRVSGQLWPQIDFTANAIRSRFSQNLFTSSFLGPSTQNTFQMGFDAIWEWDFFGRLKKEKFAAGFDVLFAEEDFRDVQILLISDVGKTYVDLCFLHEEQKLISDLIETEKKIRDLIFVQFRAGLTSKKELEAKEVELKEIENLFFEIEKDFHQLKNRLAVLLGQPSTVFTRNFQLEETIPKAPFLLKVGMPSDLLRRRPDIRKAENKVAAANARVGAAIGEYFPSFSLVADVGLDANKLSKWYEWGSRTWGIGPSMVLPIFRFGRIQGNVDEKNALLQASLHGYEKTILLALEDTENAMVAYLNAETQKKLFLETVFRKREESLLYLDLYRSGINDAVSYLNLEKELLQQKRALLQAQRNVSVNLISLYKALGGGWQC